MLAQISQVNLSLTYVFSATGNSGQTVVLQYMFAHAYVLYCVLFYWYLLSSRKANFYVMFGSNKDNKDSVFCIQM